MYLTVKQQVKRLSKEDYLSLKSLCHAAKNLANEAIYNVRQYYFTEGEYLRYKKIRSFEKQPQLQDAEFQHGAADLKKGRRQF